MKENWSVGAMRLHTNISLRVVCWLACHSTVHIILADVRRQLFQILCDFVDFDGGSFKNSLAGAPVGFAVVTVEGESVCHGLIIF